MAYIQCEAKPAEVITEIGRHNRDALLKDQVETEGVFYALQHKKPNAKPKQEEVDEEEEEETSFA